MTPTLTQTSLPLTTAPLRKVLMLDATTCVAMGVLLAFGADLLAGWLALPERLLFWAGALLFPCAALMLLTAFAGRGPKPPPALSWLVIVGNVAWIGGSLGVLALYSPGWVGTVFVVAQAAVVAGLAWVEYRSR